MSKARGSRYERELVNTLDALGYGVLRIPASGAASGRDLPDVIVGDPREGPDGSRLSSVWAVEAKAGRQTTLYVEESEVDALTSFCEAFGATPYLAARFTRQATPTAHFFVRPEDARRTDAGTYGLPLEDIQERASVRFEP